MPHSRLLFASILTFHVGRVAFGFILNSVSTTKSIAFKKKLETDENSNDDIHSQVVRLGEPIQEIQGPLTAGILAESNCWGQQPLLIRSAFDPHEVEKEFGAWPQKEDISMLACDEDAESRLITCIPDDESSYQLQIGPFMEEDVQNLLDGADEVDTLSSPLPKWTLVINDVDRFHPPLADWIHKSFSFLPTWLRDDGQVSLSQTGGGIGPHVDNYDVFLIQTSGQREWKISNRFLSLEEEMKRNVPGLDVRVLSETLTTSEPLVWNCWNLDPGDCLYLPPRIAHQGIALSDNSITLSVGCRAPSAMEMISKMAEEMTMKTHGKSIQRYQDLNLLDPFAGSVPNVDGTEIAKEAKESGKQLVKEAILELLDDEDAWDHWFGSFVTEPKRLRIGYPIALSDANSLDDDNKEEKEQHQRWLDSLGIWGNPRQAVASVLNGLGFLYQAEGIVFSYSRNLNTNSKLDSGQYSYRLFVNGLSWDIKSPSVSVNIITNERKISHESFQGVNICEETITLLEDLVEKGLLYGSDE